MSGGVDSAVAAARAAEAGHDVTGVHLALSANPQFVPDRRARLLHAGGRPRRPPGRRRHRHPVLRLGHGRAVPRRRRRRTSSPSTPRGNTPNPCLRCNEKIKFAAVLDRAVALGFDAVCTGHHARLEPAPDGARLTRLVRSVDAAKDQSYVLAVLTGRPARAGHVPARRQHQGPGAQGGRRSAGSAWPTSPTATTSASSPTATPAGSCATSSAARPVRSSTPTEPCWAATTAATGSRSGSARGSAWTGPPPDGRPRFVLGIEPVSRTVTVGPAEALDVLEIEAERPVWSGCAPPSGPVDCLVQLRAHGEVHPAVCVASRRRGPDQPGEPARGVAPGQAAVFYDDDDVLGSATITAAH